MLQFILTQLI